MSIEDAQNLLEDIRMLVFDFQRRPTDSMTIGHLRAVSPDIAQYGRESGLPQVEKIANGLTTSQNPLSDLMELKRLLEKTTGESEAKRQAMRKKTATMVVGMISGIEKMWNDLESLGINREHPAGQRVPEAKISLDEAKRSLEKLQDWWL